MSQSPRQYQQAFLDSEAAVEIKSQLVSMESDPLYITKSSYTPHAEGDISFTDKHFAYLSLHQNVKPSEYMANLRLKTKSRARR